MYLTTNGILFALPIVSLVLAGLAANAAWEFFHNRGQAGR